MFNVPAIRLYYCTGQIIVQVELIVFTVENGAVTALSPTDPGPTNTTAEVSGDQQLVPSTEELRRVRDEMKELREAVDRLRSQCDRHVKQLQDELNGEKTARQQLASEVERLKKIVATKCQSF